MLKLKKTNLTAQQKSKIESDQQTQVYTQRFQQQPLKSLLQQKPLSYQKILAHLSQPVNSSSISGQNFVNILGSILLQANLKSSENSEEFCPTILLKLISIPHDSSEVKLNLKKNKKIDSLLLLAILWSIRKQRKCWKYVNYIVQSYPTEIMLNGKQYMEKWEEYFQQRAKQIRIQKQLQQMIKQKQLKQRLLKKIQSKNAYGFNDTYINL